MERAVQYAYPGEPSGCVLSRRNTSGFLTCVSSRACHPNASLKRKALAQDCATGPFLVRSPAGCHRATDIDLRGCCTCRATQARVQLRAVQAILPAAHQGFSLPLATPYTSTSAKASRRASLPEEFPENRCADCDPVKIRVRPANGVGQAVRADRCSLGASGCSRQLNSGTAVHWPPADF